MNPRGNLRPVAEVLLSQISPNAFLLKTLANHRRQPNPIKLQQHVPLRHNHSNRIVGNCPIAVVYVGCFWFEWICHYSRLFGTPPERALDCQTMITTIFFRAGISLDATPDHLPAQ